MVSRPPVVPPACDNGIGCPACISRRSLTLGMLAGLAALPASRSAASERTFPRLRRGINLHNLLNWPETTNVNGRLDYVWPPFSSTRYDMPSSEFAVLKSLKFDFVRVTVDPSILIAADADRWTYLKDHMETVVETVLEAGFNLVFDLHPVTVNPEYAPDILVDPAHKRVFEAYAAMVEKVARMLNRFPIDRVVFELINEPCMPSLKDSNRWQTMLEVLHGRARAGASDLPLLLTGMAWGDRRGLMKLDVGRFRDSNVLYTFHYYDPHTFTHQGVRGDDAQYVLGLRWPTDKYNIPVVEVHASELIAKRGELNADQREMVFAQTMRLLRELMTYPSSETTVKQDFGEVGAWIKANGIAADRVLLGEFGCVLSSNGQNVGPDRLRWLTAVREAAEENGFGWAYWAYKGYGGMEFVGPDNNAHSDLYGPLGLK